MALLFQLGITALILWISYTFIKWYLHPLRKFPGPFLASISNIPYIVDSFGGKQPFRQLELHNKYGPIVRVAPNELSFNSPGSWRDIYGPRKDGVPTFIKGDFYEGSKAFGEGVVTSVISERDPVMHAEMRGYLSSSFSDRSLREQESLIADCVDRMVERIGVLGQSEEKGINMNEWYHLTTFDIIGSLAFGQDFGGVERGTDHFWVAALMKAMQFGALSDFLMRFPIFKTLLPALFPGVMKKAKLDARKHLDYTFEVVRKRMASISDRPDFLTKILEAREMGAEISDARIAGHSSDFVIAGSETVAVALSTITYYILKQPEVMAELKSEVRSTFSHYEEINAATAVPLKYLRALCLEAMRVYPPLAFSLPRLVPEGGATVDGVFIPGGVTVSTSPFAASMSQLNFKDPFKFDPERWLKNNPTDALHASQPFLCGPRQCLGRTLAWMELATIVAKIIFKYDLELLNKDADWLKQSEMRTIWLPPPLMVRVRPRAG